MTTREKLVEMVTYILPPEDRQHDVIQNYVDTLMTIVKEHHTP